MYEILIDITRLLGRHMKGRLPTGVDRVSLAYTRHFASRARAVVRLGRTSLVLSRPASGRLFEELISPSPSFRLGVLRLAGKDALRIKGTSRLGGAFLINTGHSGLEIKGYSMRLRRRGIKTLFMVHDLIPITHPEYCRAREHVRHVTRMKNALLSSGLVVNSHATLDELLRFAVGAGLPLPPAVVAPLAPAHLAAPSPERPMDAPYFVVLGTIEPRKNHLMLLNLWREMVERLGDGAPRLVVIGQRGWECEDVLRILERSEKLAGFVMEKPALSDGELATYLCHSQALLFPSFVEGYGLPLVEALSLDVPVIASDLLVFREVAAGIPDYVSPLDAVGWKRLIEDFTDPASEARAKQKERMSRFVSPTWQEHFAAVEELMARLNNNYD